MPTPREVFLENEMVSATVAEADAQGGCGICRGTDEDVTDPVSMPCPGKHVYCRDCITPWLEKEDVNTCPYCSHVLFPFRWPPRPRDFDHDDGFPGAATRTELADRARELSKIPNGDVDTFHMHFNPVPADLTPAMDEAVQWMTSGQDVHGQHFEHEASVLVNRHALGHHLVAMGNLMNGYIEACGEQWDHRQAMCLRLAMMSIFNNLIEGQVLTVYEFKLQLLEHARTGPNATGIGGAWHAGDAGAAMVLFFMDHLIVYVMTKAKEEFDNQRR